MRYLENIRELRKAKGLTQMDMSEKIGMAKNNYGKVENGHIELTVKRLYEIADILGVSVTTLLGEETGGNERVAELEKEIVQLQAEKAKVEQSLNTINRMFEIIAGAMKGKEAELEGSLKGNSGFLNLIQDIAEDVSNDEKLNSIKKPKI